MARSSSFLFIILSYILLEDISSCVGRIWDYKLNWFSEYFSYECRALIHQWTRSPKFFFFESILIENKFFVMINILKFKLTNTPFLE